MKKTILSLLFALPLSAFAVVEGTCIFSLASEKGGTHNFPGASRIFDSIEACYAHMTLFCKTVEAYSPVMTQFKTTLSEINGMSVTPVCLEQKTYPKPHAPESVPEPTPDKVSPFKNNPHIERLFNPLKEVFESIQPQLDPKTVKIITYLFFIFGLCLTWKYWLAVKTATLIVILLLSFPLLHTEDRKRLERFKEQLPSVDLSQPFSLPDGSKLIIKSEDVELHQKNSCKILSGNVSTDC